MDGNSIDGVTTLKLLGIFISADLSLDTL